MNTGITQASISISPSISGNYAWSGGNQVLTLTPTVPLTYGVTYTVTMSTSAVSSGNIQSSTPTIASFTAGSPVTTPAVYAFGVESQPGCPTTLAGATGSAAGGNWLLAASCYWSILVPMLTPSSYQFTGGDNGTGLSGSTNACADQTTDNFRIIFNTYMDTNATQAAVSLKRLSPPLTSIALASSVWTDCQLVSPYGCRVLTLSYAEQEASCNGNLFGNISTGGDFNLLKTTPAVANYPLYQITVSSSAKDTNGVFMTPFNFSLIGQ